MVRSFLDLSDYKKSRPELRRLEKNLKDSKEYTGRIGRVFFFAFPNEFEFGHFIKSMISGCIKNGDRVQLVEIDNPYYQGQKHKF
jgi:hypothetical protein